jgi:hypothetical protein
MNELNYHGNALKEQINSGRGNVPAEKCAVNSAQCSAAHKWNMGKWGITGGLCFTQATAKTHISPANIWLNPFYVLNSAFRQLKQKAMFSM